MLVECAGQVLRRIEGHIVLTPIRQRVLKREQVLMRPCTTDAWTPSRHPTLRALCVPRAVGCKEVAFRAATFARKCDAVVCSGLCVADGALVLEHDARTCESACAETPLLCRLWCLAPALARQKHAWSSQDETL